MALHYIFAIFFIIAFAIAIIRLLLWVFRDDLSPLLNYIPSEADRDIFQSIIQSTFDAAETSVDLSIYLIGAMTLWLGIMKIGEHGGAVNVLSKIVSPVFQRLFPSLPKNHPASGSMIMNFSANMLGLDNAATPLGLKAMRELQDANLKKDEASNAQIMFIVLNTSGLTIIPVSVMALRASGGAASASDIFLPILMATFFATMAGLISVSIFQKINLFQRPILLTFGGLTALIILTLFGFSTMPPEKVGVVSGIAGNFIIFSIIMSFIFMGLRNKVNLFESFIGGAKEGFQVAVSIIPYLVFMLVAIGVFRASGALDIFNGGLKYAVALTGLPTEWVDAMPTAYMKPLSGSGARAMMVDSWSAFGVDSFAGKLASVFQGSTETTFYTLAVYFGAVNIRRTRHAVTCGLIADITGIIAAIFIAYIFFGG